MNVSTCPGVPVSVPPLAPLRVRERLADRGCWKTVAAMVRRRVPESEAEDLTQTVLCDALAAPRVPSDESELRRFLSILARNKVVDFHRRAHRAQMVPLEDDMSLPSAEPSSVEARALLERVVNDASPRDRETLRWLVREHEGEELGEIASELGLPAPTVRQRVSRLRRALRAQWAHVLALLVLTGSCGAAVRHSLYEERATITADPSGDPGLRALGLAQGRWRIADSSLVEKPPVDTRFVEVRVTGRKIEILSPLHVTTRSITRSSPIDAHTYAVELTDDRGHVEEATLAFAGETMIVSTRGGLLRGTATLARK